MTNEEKLLKINELNQEILEIEKELKDDNYTVLEQEREMFFAAINEKKELRFDFNAQLKLMGMYGNLSVVMRYLAEYNQKVIIDVIKIGCGLTQFETEIIFANERCFNYVMALEQISKIISYDLRIKEMTINAKRNQIAELKGEELGKGKY